MSDADSRQQERQFLVLAPTRKDAELTAEILGRAGVSCVICSDVAYAANRLQSGAAAALLIAEDVLDQEGIRQLARALSRQPPWSDLPLLVLTRPGADSGTVSAAVESLGNVSLLERPVRIATLVSAARMALRARERQYELRQYLETVHRSERNLTDFFENAAVGLHFVNAEGIITRANQTELNLLGYAPEEYLGHHVAEFHADPEVIGGIWKRLHAGETIESEEARLLAKDGTIRHVLISSNVLWEDGRFIHTRCFTRDITPRKLAEESLREADRRKDEFLATLAHELRNPLAPIRNSLHILRLAGDRDPACERVCDMIDRQVNHMIRLVDDLMEVSRITRGKIELKLEPVELAAVVRSAVETSRPLIDAAGHQLAIALPTERLVVRGDIVRLAQILSNLLNNAAKYTLDGGQIWLTVRPDLDHVAISVRDTGIGIPADMLDRVFEMFTQVRFSASRTQGGLGIGLSLVRSLVQMHGGTVEAKSGGLGEGSEFIVRLPLAVSQDSAAGKSQPDQAGVLPPQRVLVVDDNRDSANSLGMLLRLMGAEVEVVYDGPSALDAVKRYRPAVVLLDLGMPGMDGYEVAQRIHEDHAFDETKLIALTGWGQEEDRRRVFSAGFDHHLVKPAELSVLKTLLSSLPYPSSE